MTNTDDKFGVFNKRTHILHQLVDPAKTLTNVEEAKQWFFHDPALAVHDETCTLLEWVLLENTKLKYTMAFGTKGTPVTESEDWAGQYETQKAALIEANGWAKNTYRTERSEDHLF